LEGKLAAAEKRLEELEESSWQRIAELEERVLALEQDSQDELMQSLVDKDAEGEEKTQSWRAT
jgi:hypothetical protein